MRTGLTFISKWLLKSDWTINNLNCLVQSELLNRKRSLAFLSHLKNKSKKKTVSNESLKCISNVISAEFCIVNIGPAANVELMWNILDSPASLESICRRSFENKEN